MSTRFVKGVSDFGVGNQVIYGLFWRESRYASGVRSLFSSARRRRSHATWNTGGNREWSLTRTRNSANQHRSVDVTVVTASRPTRRPSPQAEMPPEALLPRPGLPANCAGRRPAPGRPAGRTTRPTMAAGHIPAGRRTHRYSPV